LLKEKRRGQYDARTVGPDAFVLERKGPQGASLLVLVNVRGTLEHRLPEGARVVLWTEATRFGGTLEAPPLHGDTVRLEGPSALVVRTGSAR
jgi:maltooligosyltrehalose trehalohydrolase